MHYRRYFILAVAILLALVPYLPARAQPLNVSIQTQPQAGPPGTVVTIFGRNAPPNARVELLFAPFSETDDCRERRDAEVAAQLTADADGRFITTHRAARMNEEQAGVTYLARVVQGEPPLAMSNLECFTFEGPDIRVFPATGYSVRGRFLDFWLENGGLPIFGNPLSFVRRMPDAGEQAPLMQYFERQRFELYPRNRAPYDVLLGRLGDEVLRQRGVDWQTLPPASPAAGCMYVEVTRHNICDQGNGIGFRSYWMSNGLEFDGRPGASFEESLALFGYPLTEAFMETNSSGDHVLTQWFERARFEWHPDNPDSFKVLLGRVGAEVLDDSIPLR